MKTTYNISEAAKRLGVSVKTLQRWDRNGKLVAKRTPTNRRYYTLEQINKAWDCVRWSTNDIIELILHGYDVIENNNMSMGNGNIQGHIVYPYYRSQEYSNIIPNFDMEYIDDNTISICQIYADNNCRTNNVDLVIISVKSDVPEDTRMKWLYSCIKRSGAERGIVIAGYQWNMVDRDGKEYTVNFQSDINAKDFERFLI